MNRTVVSLWGVIVFLALWAPVYGGSLAGDTDRDGDVDFIDFLALASNFGRTDGDAGGTTIETISVYPWGEAVGPDRVDGEILIASWNVRIFSTGSRDDAELGLIADRLQQFDLIAIQELRDEEVVQRTLATLGERGLPYQAIVSDKVGRTTTERYAFIFRSDRVEALDLGAFFDDVSDDFIREPFYAHFRAGAFDFRLVTIHAIYGSTKGERRAEAEMLDEVYNGILLLGEQDVIVLGDFNLEPEDEGFDGLRQDLTSLVTGDIRTTISQSSLLDNIWLSEGLTSEYAGRWGVDRFDWLEMDNDDDAASLAVSDHRPVWAAFKTQSDDD